MKKTVISALAIAIGLAIGITALSMICPDDFMSKKIYFTNTAFAESTKEPAKKDSAKKEESTPPKEQTEAQPVIPQEEQVETYTYVGCPMNHNHDDSKIPCTLEPGIHTHKYYECIDSTWYFVTVEKYFDDSGNCSTASITCKDCGQTDNGEFHSYACIVKAFCDRNGNMNITSDATHHPTHH